MKFVIELEDFWMDDQEDLEPKLKQHIISSCVHQITKALEKKIEEGVDKEVKAQVEQTLYRKIGSFVNETITNDTIKGRYSTDPVMTLQEYVKKQFTETAQQKAPTDAVIEKLAKQFGEDLKKRYDMLFASGIVQKLHESGMLKEDVVSRLLESKTD